MRLKHKRRQRRNASAAFFCARNSATKTLRAAKRRQLLLFLLDLALEPTALDGGAHLRKGLSGEVCRKFLLAGKAPFAAGAEAN
jgi:hypothetical protein